MLGMEISYPLFFSIFYINKICCTKIRLEKKTVKRKKVFATLRVLGTVLEDLTREIAPDDAAKIISEEVYIVFLRNIYL